jgi:hypothetical protein
VWLSTPLTTNCKEGDVLPVIGVFENDGAFTNKPPSVPNDKELPASAERAGTVRTQPVAARVSNTVGAAPKLGADAASNIHSASAFRKAKACAALNEVKQSAAFLPQNAVKGCADAKDSAHIAVLIAVQFTPIPLPSLVIKLLAIDEDNLTAKTLLPDTTL